MPIPSREWHLITRPVGHPKPTDFACVTTTVPDPGPDQVLVRNDWLSVDPYMVGRLNEGKSPLSDIPPYELGEPLTGGAIGTVIASNVDTIPVGASVSHFLGWREYALLPAKTVQVVDASPAGVQSYLGLLGVTGLTAYAALTVIAPVKTGDVVYISAAAGAVGSVAGQIAKHLGASLIIGSAGGPEKVNRLVGDLGYDAAVDYRAGDLATQLAEAAPAGIDVYLDNVGGDHLEAALTAMNVGGRIALCGAISALGEPPLSSGPGNMPLVIGKRLTLRGMNVADHYDILGDYLLHANTWLQDGSLHSQETVVDGIDNAAEALLAMMSGANTGKMLVRLPRS